MSTIPFPALTPNATSIELKSNTDKFTSPITGAVQTVDRTGERLAISVSLNNLKDADRRTLMSFCSRMNGQANRVSLRDHSYTAPTGTLSTVGEMLDVTFNSSNWTTSSAARGTLSDISEGMRYTVQTTQLGALIRPSTGADGISAPTEALNYAATVFFSDGRASSLGGSACEGQLSIDDANTSGVDLAGSPSTSSAVGSRHVVGVTAPSASVVFIRPLGKGSTGEFGSSIDISRLSVARCLLVDNGFNALTKSEEFDHADWTKTRSSISADATTAPDGSTTADELIEDGTASNNHFTRQVYTRTSTQEYWTGSLYIKENTSQRIRLKIDDGSSNGGQAYFDANTGTITGAASDTGTGTNSFASIHSIGNSWYRCRLTTNVPATTSARMDISLCNGAANTVNYNGDGSSGLYVWGAQIQRGGQLGRYTATTTAAITGTDQTGKSIWLKGLDVSTDGQLLAGDQMEINGQLVILDEDLDGDASGIGLAKVSPRIRIAPSDEAAAVLYQPHGTFLLDGGAKWSNSPGGFSSTSMTFIEDIT